ncbi:hypothetical protein CONPUDRAFT_168593 [Coniophora puteana RWD-64-598 SS2]|uniref:Uncharacterized protein n=1 Tax=Coniophora puteana (strain RWD-64-598) TaxID=741705 RepID=A0A5M3MCQ5_CONPW|nr:uncharacterized protein CONPUDRAFT_168593 [Coniophora puteana RWD-64-598 SS2]EIW76853.1 hypothetical protein CONPUDRAFT_168593 [Coniophora puteana RWD-64-598 SS2]
MSVLAELTPDHTPGARVCPHVKPTSISASKHPTASPHLQLPGTTTGPSLHPLNLNVITNACVLLEQLQTLEHGCAAARARICTKYDLVGELEKRLRTLKLSRPRDDDLDSCTSDLSLETAETSARHTLVSALALVQTQNQAQDTDNASPQPTNPAASQSSPVSHRTPLISPRLRGMFDLYGPGGDITRDSFPGPGMDFKSPSVYSERSSMNRAATGPAGEGEEDCYGIWEAATCSLFESSPCQKGSGNCPSQACISQASLNPNKATQDLPTKDNSPIHCTRESSTEKQAEKGTIAASRSESRSPPILDIPLLEPPRSDGKTTSLKKQKYKGKQEGTDSVPISSSRRFGITHAVSLLHFSVSERSQRPSYPPESDAATAPSVLIRRASNKMHPQASTPRTFSPSVTSSSIKPKKKVKDAASVKRRASQKQKKQKRAFGIERSAGKPSALGRLLLKRRKSGKKAATPG